MLARLLTATMLALQAERVRAPTGSSFSALSAGRRPPARSGELPPASSFRAGAAAACAAAVACAVVGVQSQCTQRRALPGKGDSFASTATSSSASAFFHAAGVLLRSSSSSESVDEVNDEVNHSESSSSVLDSDNEAADYDQPVDVSDDEQPEAASKRSAPGAGKLWTSAHFPEGTEGSSNYDMANLLAMQAWCCPCEDRQSCIGADRLSVLELYEHRKAFRTTSHLHGGFRDATRKEMLLRYDKHTKTFTRAFKVGPLIDCCAASAGLASGVSFATWASARADLKRDRPWRAGRKQHRSNVESLQRAHLNAYIRDLRESMEGPKGGSDPTEKWRAEKLPLSKRWEAYKKSRLRQGLPVIGMQLVETPCACVSYATSKSRLIPLHAHTL